MVATDGEAWNHPPYEAEVLRETVVEAIVVEAVAWTAPPEVSYTVRAKALPTQLVGTVTCTPS